ncbi:MAG: hypothetical protein RQ757_02435 [Pseudomonadales bacterium]|nr:hypothetical protein [Pseudomonadales bacterium]
MGQSHHQRRLTLSSYRLLRLGQRFLPPILRGVLGVLLTMLGFLGFLPVLGFWMIPLGLALLATDLPPLRRWFIRHLNQQRRKQRRKPDH